ncbi:MAG: GatB/YqeY domain-containing protein [bacterium]|nr:GatB/YqeY domain-containing protein [bacterium]
MRLTERLAADAREALRARDGFRLSALRLARAALQNAAIEKRSELEDTDAIAVLAREIRQRREAAEEYRRLGRDDAAAGLEREAAILGAYLPPPLTGDELDGMIREAIVETGAASQRDLGRVMAVLMPRLRGRADGGAVNLRLRELLPPPQA